MLYPLSYEGGGVFVLVRACYHRSNVGTLHVRSWYVAAWPRATPVTPRQVSWSRACSSLMSNG
jgi:hypothetical protein